MPRSWAASAIKSTATYRNKIGLDKAPDDRIIAPQEVEWLEGAEGEEFLRRFTPYALSSMKADRIAQTEKANAMAHFNWQAYATINHGAEVAEQLGEYHERFEKGRDQSGNKSEELPDSIADRINNALARVLVETYRDQMPGLDEQLALVSLHKAKLSADAWREKVTEDPRWSLKYIVPEDIVDKLFETSWEKGHLAQARPHEKDYIRDLSKEDFHERFIAPLANLWHTHGVTGIFTKAEAAALLEKDPDFPRQFDIPMEKMIRQEDDTAADPQAKAT